MEGELLDTIYDVETPEGIRLQLKPAGPGARAVAYLIDLLYRIIAYVVISFIFGLLGATGLGIALILFFLVEWWYPIYFELLRDGATPGKKRMGLRVVHDDGTPINFAASLIRNLLRVVDFLPIIYVAGVICSVMNASYKRIGDLAAGSVVVYVHKAEERVNIDIDGVLPPFAELTPDEQNALISFGERSKLLTRERAFELATILRPLLRQYDGPPDDIIKRIAKGLIGQK